MRSSHATLCGVVLTCAVWCAPASGADAPEWLVRAAATPTTADERSADAIVLNDEVQVSVAADGRLVSKRYYAVRIGTEDGAKNAAIREVYTTDDGEVRIMRGWILRDGRSTEVDRKAIVDLSLAANDVYNEARARLLRPSDLAPGMVFGAETEVIDRSPYPQLDWPLQGAWPVHHLRRTLTLPAGWDARSIVFNYAAVEPTRSGSQFTWALEALPAVDAEIAAPPMTSGARLAVTWGPSLAAGPVLDDWVSVSRWLADLSAGQATASPALAAKARELTVSASTSLDKIRAIGQYVQRVQYISVQTGLGRGGGYKPHPAADVFTRNYGDCKDKANLMRAMLESIGIHARLVAIYLGDPDYVQPEWASPQQFNHCIVAISVGAEIVGYPVLEHPALGRMLFFDPTDEDTPVGELPIDEQNSFALVMASPGAPLVKVPGNAVSPTSVIRQVEATLTPGGALAATIVEMSAGAAATSERRLRRALTVDEYAKRMEVDAQRQIAGARIVGSDVRDGDQTRNAFQVTLKLEADRYAQAVGGGLLLFRAPRAWHLAVPQLPEGRRRSPVRLEAMERREHVSLSVPAGLTLDELPPAVLLDTPFGQTAVKWAVEDGRITRDLSIRLKPVTVPAADYNRLKTFLDAAIEAEGEPVLLVTR